MCQPPTPQQHPSTNDPLHLQHHNQRAVGPRHIEWGLAVVSVLYGCVYAYASATANIRATPEYSSCRHHHDTQYCSTRPDLLAYKVTSGLCMLTMATVGCYHWYYRRLYNQSSSQRSTPHHRLLAAHPAADIQNALIFVYQLWDLCVSLSIPEFRSDPIFITHHILTATVAYWSYTHQLLGYYAVYFGGVSELSSVWLVWADVTEVWVVRDSASWIHTFQHVCQGLFVVTFTYVRVIAWMRWSVQVWRDTLYVLSSKDNSTLEKYRPGRYSRSLLYGFLTLNALLGSLQVFWMGVIVQKLYGMVNASEDDEGVAMTA